jgi:HAD superfamily phosphoserine phosphatase-like hydrolase
MSRQVLETMIRKAGLIQHKYKLIVFTLDETLIARSALKNIYVNLGLGDKIKNSNNQFKQNKISSGRYIKNMAKVLKGTSMEEIERVVNKAPLTQYAVEVIGALQRRKYKVAIISSNFSPIVQCIAKKLGANQDSVDCIYMEQKDGKLTGKISPASQKRWFGEDGDIVFGPAFKRILRINKTKAIETIMVANSPKATPLQNTVGLSIAYNPKNKKLRSMADKTISILAEILALVE